MSYRRVAKSYRRSIASRYRQLEQRPRARLAAMAGLLVVVLAVGMAFLIAPHFGTNLSASSSAANLASACTTSSPSTSAAPATSVGGAVSTSAAATAVQAQSRRRRHRHFPTATPTVTAPVTTAPVTTAPATTAPVTTTPGPTATATTAPVAVANVSCNIIVPANPLSATGLATPWQLTGTGGATPAASGCNMANAANLGAFVQATILDPATGALQVYEPLVITAGTTPAAAPVVPTLPAGAVVTIDAGFNGTNLTQVGATPTALQQGNCVTGLNGSIFGQVSFCNGINFFQAAFRAEAQGNLVVPSAGISPKTGQACPTTRNFNMIDQDPSDNVTTDYLLTATGQTAQSNAANNAALAGATNVVNGSDNKLLAAFLNPTLGCTSFEAPDLSMGGTPGTSQALNELSAAKSQAAPVALVPPNDEMVLVNNAPSITKVNLYRSEIGQPPVSGRNNGPDTAAGFCQNMINIQTPFLNTNQALLATGASPVPAVGNNLFTFLANRLSMSFTNLGCAAFGLTNSVTVTLDGNGVATAATFNTAPQTANVATPAAPPAPGQRRGHGRHNLMNPSGM